MKANPTRFWILVIALGWAFDFLFWEKSLGINFFLYVTFCLGGGAFLLQSDGLRLARRAGLILIPIAFLAAMTFLRLEPMTALLSASMTLFLMGVLALSYLGGHWIHYGLIDYVLGYLALFGSMLARPLGFMTEGKRDQLSEGERRASPLWAYLRGVIIALSIVAVFGALLSSADPIFGKRFQDFVDLFNIENLPEYIFRLVYILMIAYALAGIYLHAARKSDDRTERRTLFNPFLGFTESAIVLGSVAILFAAFVVILFQYFFGGNANITLEGYTYAEYARRGFGELVAVAFFSLLLLLGMGAITRRETDLQRSAFSGIGVGLVVLVLVMLVSAFQRLVLYESAYGFSRLRTYTHVFMIWLALLLAAVVVLELLRRERAIGFSMVLASLGFILSLGVLNVDAFIVRHNIERELNGTAVQSADASSLRGQVELDTQYFLNLSDDAIPALAAGFQNQSLPVTVHEKLGAALACKQHEREGERNTWQGFHFSQYLGDRSFASIAKSLEAYVIDDSDSPVMVITPGEGEYSCSAYYDD